MSFCNYNSFSWILYLVEILHDCGFFYLFLITFLHLYCYFMSIFSFSHPIYCILRWEALFFWFSEHNAAAAAKLLQSCLTLCDPIDGGPPGSPVPGILQARTLEWVAISFSNAWKGKVKVKSFSCVRLFATPWSAAYQAPPSMGFSRQEYWSGVPLPSPLNIIDEHYLFNCDDSC